MKVLAAALFFLAAGLSAENLSVRRMALFVGANQGGPSQQPLLYAQKDALKMQQVMQEVGGVGPADRIVLLDPSPDDVRSALAALSSRMKSSDNRRTEFMFYYSGHSDEEGLLLGPKSLSYKALRDDLQKIDADVRIAILDSCSSGAFARLKGGVQRAPFLNQDSSQMKGHAFLTSSSENEASQESDTLQGSFFTHYLVSGLRGGADRVGDGLITLDEAYEYAFQNTLARTESTQAGPQHPSYEIQLSGTGNLILSDVKSSKAQLDVAADVEGRLYVRNLQGQLFAEVLKLRGTPLSLALPQGTYSVTAVTTKASLSARVTLGPAATRLGASDFQARELERYALRGTEEPEAWVEPEGAAYVPFSLSLIPGLPGSGWGDEKSLGLSLIIDLATGVSGTQASSVMSLNNSFLQGFQLAGVGSISNGPVHGFQMGGVFSIAGQGFKGGQASGVFNIAAGSQSGAAQAAGVFNLSRGTFQGVQVSGVLNVADTIDGVQASTVNIAGEVHGFQVGLVNINKHIDGGGLGLIFISPDAFYQPILLFDNKSNTLSLFQWGMGSLYWITGVVGSPLWKDGIENAWGGLAGVGYRKNLDGTFWDTDLGWLSQIQADQYEGGRPYVRTTVGLEAGVMALEAGVMALPSVDWSPDEIRNQIETRWYAGLRFF